MITQVEHNHNTSDRRKNHLNHSSSIEGRLRQGEEGSGRNKRQEEDGGDKEDMEHGRKQEIT